MQFQTGEIFFSQGVYAQLEDPTFNSFVMTSLTRHKQCDWGDSPKEDHTSNNLALNSGARLFSSYQGPQKIWIITESVHPERGRHHTTILFPSEY